MSRDGVEHEFMGKKSSKMWTYLILLGLLLIIVVALNFWLAHRELMHDGVSSFLGLPAWALGLIVFALGALIYWGGLKVETDWPEAVGAFLMTGSIVAFEFIVGWSKFDIGGMFVIPYLIPIVMFLALLGYAMKRSV